jgi:hypothetical protein
MAATVRGLFMTTPPTAEEIRELLTYVPETGRWIRNGKDFNGYPNNRGYRRIMVGRTFFLAHRLAWLWVHGEWPCGQIDHINGNREDNRLCNIRVVDNATNGQNRKRAVYAGRLLGAYPHGKGFRAKICVHRKRIGLGTFPTEQQAHQAYLEAKRKLHAGCTI